jgi:hypothetical protein
MILSVLMILQIWIEEVNNDIDNIEGNVVGQGNINYEALQNLTSFSS